MFCAYHGNIPLGEGQLIYSVDPYVDAVTGCDDGHHPNGVSDSAIQGGLSHEQNESITDPEPNNAWTDLASIEPGEIADKCEQQFGSQLGTAPDGSPYNQVINGDLYWYQQEWSNQGHRCMQRLTFTGERPVATFLAIPEGRYEIRLDAAASTAAGGVAHYDWQLNEGGGPGLPIETTEPTLTRELPPGPHTIALTVYAPDGTSTGTARTFTTGGEGPTATFTAPATATPATPVAFDASASSDPETPIVSYAWGFGDGSTGSGITIDHSFAAPLTYQVTLSVTDGAGLSATETRQVAVAEATRASEPPAKHAATAPLTPPAVLSGTLALTRTSRVRRDGRTAVTLSCTGNAPACAGSLRLTVQISTGHGKRRHRRTITLATASCMVPGGRTATVRLTLDSAGRALLHARRGRLDTTFLIHTSLPLPARDESRTLRLNR